MSVRRAIIKAVLSTCIGINVCLGCSLSAAAELGQVEANKAIAKQYLEALGTKKFAAVARASRAKVHQQLRYEFNNLKYNADNSELAALARPDYIAIPDRTNTITRLMGEGDLVAASILVKGTHKANFYGIPATGKTFEFDTVAILKMANGKVVETWLVADEMGLLRKLGTKLPRRKDGKWIVPPNLESDRSADDVLKDLQSNPIDSQAYRNKALMVAYKAKNKPPGYPFTGVGPGQSYGKMLRAGNQSTVDMLNEIKATSGKAIAGSFMAAWSDRDDRIGHIITEGNMGMMQFSLNALNSGSLYTIPASNNTIRIWEVVFTEFDGNKWNTAWWFGDEIGMMLQIGSEAAHCFFLGDGAIPN
jgi:predicted ester cyclase